MKIKRTQLIEALKIARPALAARMELPIFSCFCFQDGTVSACNDAIGIRTPVAVDFEGGITGSLLLDLLSASRAVDVEFADGEDEKEVVVKAGRSRLKTTVQDPEEFVFKERKSKSAQAIKLTPKFLDALEKVAPGMILAGTGDAPPWSTGMTLELDGRRACLYSGGNLVVIRAEVNHKSDKLQANIRHELITLLLQMRKTLQPVSMTVASKWTRVEFKDGTILQASNLASPEVGQYKAILEEVPDVKPVDIPKGFAQAVDRALVILEGEDPGTKITAGDEGGKMMLRLFSSSPAHGNLRDRLRFDDDHPEAEVKVTASYVKKVLGHATSMFLVEDYCLLLTGPGFGAVVPAIMKAKE